MLVFTASVCQVSTKSGLDPGAVWQAWGMASLKAGNLTGAREKFARCLKAPMDRNQLNLGPLLLQEIIQHLENSVHPSLATVGRLLLDKQHCCFSCCDPKLLSVCCCCYTHFDHKRLRCTTNSLERWKLHVLIQVFSLSCLGSKHMADTS